MFTQTPKYSNLHIHCHENLKCYFILVYSLVSSVLNSYASMTLICSRHDCEQELIKIRKQIQNLNKQLAVNLKKIKNVETALQNNEVEFEILQVGS